MENYAKKNAAEYTLLDNNVCVYLQLFLLGIVITWYVQWLWKRKKLYALSKNIPGPFSFPLIGNMFLLSLNSNNILTQLQKLAKEYPGIRKLWMGPMLLVTVNTTQYAERIFTDPKLLNKPFFYTILADGLGDGLITSEAQKWRKHRKLIAPSFNQSILNSFVEIFSKHSALFAELLKNYSGRRDIDFYPLVSKCTLETICQTAMGIDMKVQNTDSKYVNATDIMLELMVGRALWMPHHIKIFWKLSSNGKKFAYYNNIISDTTFNVLRKKKVEYDKKLKEKHLGLDAEINEAPVRKSVAFLDFILENANFTDKELEEEVRTFIAAGTETSASTTCNICMLLGMFPEVQEKMYKEIMEILGPDRNVLAEDLPKMKYTERVIKETMRLFPIAPMLARYATDDIKLDENITIPEGATVFVDILNIHRDPTYWPDPLKFDPDRFLPEYVAKRHPCTYLPFSYGPRLCIGWRYALMNIKTILATLVRQYKFYCDYKSINEIELTLLLLLRIKNGSKLWFEQR